MTGMVKLYIKDLNIIPTLILLNIFNLFDAAATIFWIYYGLAEESNPLMDIAISFGIKEFFILKFSLVALGSLFLYINRNIALAKISAISCAALYNLILFYHFWGFYNCFI